MPQVKVRAASGHRRRLQAEDRQAPSRPTGVVALVGRPNVGKSTLFNRLIGERRAIVSEQPGLTRDRIYGTVEWRGATFTAIDTAGLDRVAKAGPEGDLPTNTQRQARVALDQADVICLVLDSRAGLTTGDLEVADVLRRARQPVVVVANKSEGREDRLLIHEFMELGMGDPIEISALSGSGTGDLLDRIVAALPAPSEAVEEPDSGELLRCAIVGRPNVGKSSLLNTVLGQDRSLVSTVAGTTRDPVDTLISTPQGPVLLVDTAGMKRPGATKDADYYSLLRALRVVERADVAILVVDATSPLRAHDRHIAGRAREAGAATLIAVNKWDLLDADERQDRSLLRELRSAYDFAPGTPFLFTSATTGRGIARVLPAAFALGEARALRIGTPALNQFLREAMIRRPPPSGRGGRRLHLYYAVQARSRVPTFALFVNDPELLHFSYARYLENQLRDQFGFAGVPLRLRARKSEPGS
ncbi:MAG: ribosome biogenesis GTPase Der [Candidatus Dormibacteria bacterium]